VNRFVELVRAEAAIVRRFDHPPGVAHRDPERERAASHGINFIEAGSFRVRTTGAWREVGSDSLFVTETGMEFSCAHDEDHPADWCLSITYSDDAVDSARAFTPIAGSPVRRLTNRHAFLRRAIATCSAADTARMEALAGALLCSLTAVYQPRQPLFKPDRLAWYAARVDRAKAMMEARHSEPISLSTVARDAGMSVFHFARIFAELEGQPPHRFLTAVRLSTAHTRLREGASVTDTCFAVGFGSLSHFITAFRRRYGVRPSDLTRRVRSRYDRRSAFRA
jgi:AraC family transcriptional regulator